LISSTLQTLLISSTLQTLLISSTFQSSQCLTIIAIIEIWLKDEDLQFDEIDGYELLVEFRQIDQNGGRGEVCLYIAN